MAQRARKSHIFSKEKHGHYVEPEWCSQRLFAVEKFGTRGSLILDPACGWGHIITAARAAGFRAVGCDVVDRRRTPFEFFKHNFLNGSLPFERQPVSIVCNPPFDHVEEFCFRAVATVQFKVAMLCLLRRLPAARWLQEMPLETIYFLTPRPSMPPGKFIEAGNKASGGTQDFCWLVFNKHMPAFNAWPSFRWLHRDE